jgi:hypothetical protein
MTTETPKAERRTEYQAQIVQTTHDQPIAPEAQADGVPSRLTASRGLVQMFGLDPRAATLTVLVDLMVFGGDTISLETLVPLGMCVAVALGFIVYKAQRKWYGDDRESALIKAAMIALLTAIPAPLTPLIAIPAGALGIIKAIRHKL